MSTARWPAPWCPAGALWRRDDGSLPLAALLAVVGVGLTAMLLPLTVTQLGSTRVQTGRVQALHAAQAGLDVALGRIRAAHNAGQGDLAKLPCRTLKGTLNAGGGPGYEVEIFYLNANPRGRAQDMGWINAHRQQCGLKPTAYALLKSRGTAGEADRTLWGTYVFRTTDEPVPGDLIKVYQSPGGPELCLDAGSAEPLAGTLVRVQNCKQGLSQQTFAYEKNLYIALVSSRTATDTAGLCLEAGATHAAGNLVRLQRCAAPTAARQQWSFNDFANIEGTDGKVLDGYCFNVQIPNSPNSPLVLGSKSDGHCETAGLWDSRHTFGPEPMAGAGAAGPATGQLVNRGQFGRCLDFPQKTYSGWASAWPCKQAPDPADVGSNQKWALPAAPGGRMVVVASNRTQHPADTYCLMSPGTLNGYVDLTPCPSGATPRNLKWTVRGYTGDYATNYRIEDDYGRCLAAKDHALGDFHNPHLEVSKIITTQCSGSPLQKWNAPANLVPSGPLRDVGER